MQEIPKPEMLNPDRVDRDDRGNVSAEDHRSQAQLLSKALAESCSYADQLWEQLDEVRAYLLASLPPDPRMPGPKTTASASPTGPDDEEGWQRWIATFAATTSALCGPHGDSGFGLSRAKEEAQVRRTAPIMALRHRYPQQPESAASDAKTNEPEKVSQRGGKWGSLKIAGAVITAALALRGLRRSPSPR